MELKEEFAVHCEYTDTCGSWEDATFEDLKPKDQEKKQDNEQK